MFNRITHKDGIIIGKGYPVKNPKANLQDIVLKDTHRKAHMITVGSTTIGKTYLIINMVTQDIIKGDSVVVIDPKGDLDLLSSVVQAAFGTGRQDELIYVSPIYPEISAKVDPLSYYYMPEELVSHVVSGIQAGNIQHFYNVAKEITLVIVLAMILFQKAGQKNLHINFESIKKRCSFESLENMRDELRVINSTEAQELIGYIDNILEAQKEHFGKIAGNLRTVLTDLSVGSIGQIIGKAKHNNVIKRLEAGKRVILYLQTGSMLTRDAAHSVGRVFVSMLQSFVGRRNAAGKVITPSLSLYIDEFSNFVYQDIVNLFNKGASSGIRVQAFMQSLADIVAEVGDNVARKILDSANTKLFMRVNHPETADFVAETSERTRRFSPILQLGGGMMIREMEEPSVRQEDVLNLNPRDFYLFSFEGAFKGRIRSIPKPRLRVVFPEITLAA